MIMTILIDQEITEQLRAIDIQFTKQILAYEQPSGLTELQTTHIELAALLVNMALGKGQTCLPLDNIAWLSAYPKLAKYWQQHKLDEVIQSLQQAATVFNASTNVTSLSSLSNRYGNQPLVLKGNNLYLARYYFYEQKVLEQIQSRLNYENRINDTELSQTLGQLFLPLENTIDWQKVAAASACLQNFAVITGGPGTGKTTTVTKLLSALLSLNPNLSVALAAPTGKAAARMTESIREAKARAKEGSLPNAERIPDESFTLYRLLRWRPHGFRYNARQHLPFDCVVVDEASMVDLPMMSHLLAALAPSARLILLGDRDQLASVEVGSVLADLCDAGKEHGPQAKFAQRLERITGYDLSNYVELNDKPLQNAVAQLRVSHRFDANSGIGQLAKAVNLGQESDAERAFSQFNDIQFYELDERTEPYWQQETWRQQIKNGFKQYGQALKLAASDTEDTDSANKKAKAVFAAFDQFQVLVALRQGPYGVEQVNHHITSLLRNSGIFNSDYDTKLAPYSTGADALWYPGRAIIVNKNNYDLGLFNGDIGIALHDETGQLKVAFLSSNNDVRWLMPSRIPAHETAFAITVHKSQGSEFTQLCLLLPNKWQNVITRELIYTAITRAKKEFTLYASQVCWQQGIRSRVERASGLRESLWGL